MAALNIAALNAVMSFDDLILAVLLQCGQISRMAHSFR
jgi:hypothetical protein